MKKWKRTLCVALAVFLYATLAVGCGGKENSAEKDWKKILSGYDSEKTMMIGAWNNPPHSYEAYKIAADMGLTHLFMNNNQMFQPGEKPGKGLARWKNCRHGSENSACRQFGRSGVGRAISSRWTGTCLNVWRNIRVWRV